MPAADGRPGRAVRRCSSTILDYDDYLGRILIGRVEHGQRAGSTCRSRCSRSDGTASRPAASDQAAAPSAASSACRSTRPRPATSSPSPASTDATVADTIARLGAADALPAIPVDAPTLAMIFRVNDGPFAGREGKKVTSRKIRDRLLQRGRGQRRAAGRPTASATDAFEVAGRGELHLGVLIETMRREGFELTVGRPRV